MKKIVITTIIILGLGFGAFAQQGGGLFGMGQDPQSESSNNRENGLINLPGAHKQTNDSDATTPIGGGALLLIGFGAVYALKKKKEEK